MEKLFRFSSCLRGKKKILKMIPVRRRLMEFSFIRCVVDVNSRVCDERMSISSRMFIKFKLKSRECARAGGQDKLSLETALNPHSIDDLISFKSTFNQKADMNIKFFFSISSLSCDYLKLMRKFVFSRGALIV